MVSMEHREEHVDVNVPALHWSVMRRQSHVLRIKRAMAEWQKVYGGKGAADAAATLTGVSTDAPVFGNLPMDLLTHTELAHFAYLNMCTRSNTLQQARMEAQDRRMVCRPLPEKGAGL